jgi:hypothetical protein
LCLAEQIRFTRDCELAIGNNSLTGLRASLATQLETYTTAKPADAVLSLKLKALILDIIHHIDVVDKLMAVRFLFKKNQKQMFSPKHPPLTTGNGRGSCVSIWATTASPRFECTTHSLCTPTSIRVTRPSWCTHR